MALDDHRISATEERLGTMAVPDVGCTARARQDALDRVRAMGLPQARDEYWKYTRPRYADTAAGTGRGGVRGR